MSPPAVSLGKKEPPQSAVFDELPIDKGGKIENPSIYEVGIPPVACTEVDADSQSRSIRLKKKKRCQRTVCIIALLIFVGAAAAVTFILVKTLRSHRVSWTVPTNAGQTSDVVVDDNNQLIHAQHNGNVDGKVVVIEILHEFVRHLVAYKDMNNSVCYIDRLDKTYEEGYSQWQGFVETGRDPITLKVISQPVEIEVLEHIGDVHIYGHCKSGDTYWAMEIEEEEITREMKVVRV